MTLRTRKGGLAFPAAKRPALRRYGEKRPGRSRDKAIGATTGTLQRRDDWGCRPVLARRRHETYPPRRHRRISRNGAACDRHARGSAAVARALAPTMPRRHRPGVPRCDQGSRQGDLNLPSRKRGKAQPGLPKIAPKLWPCPGESRQAPVIEGTYGLSDAREMLRHCRSHCCSHCGSWPPVRRRTGIGRCREQPGRDADLDLPDAGIGGARA